MVNAVVYYSGEAGVLNGGRVGKMTAKEVNAGVPMVYISDVQSKRSSTRSTLGLLLAVHLAWTKKWTKKTMKLVWTWGPVP